MSSKPISAVDELVSYSPPSGWTRSDYANAGGADAVVSFENGRDAIRLSVYGAPGSFYKSPADFMTGPAATTMGRAPERGETARVAGRSCVLYHHGIPIMESDPHIPASGPPRLGTEIFCVLPPLPDGRFLVLAYARESPAPDLSESGIKSWNLLINSVRQKARKPRPSGRASGSLDSGTPDGTRLQ